MDADVSRACGAPGGVFPSLAGLDQVVHDLQNHLRQQMPGEECSLRVLPATITLTSATAPPLISRILSSIEEAFTPDPLHDAGLLFENVVVPLLQRVPWNHITHFPLDETLRKLRPNDTDAFRYWVVKCLNTADSLHEAAALLLRDTMVSDAAEGRDSSFELERVTQLQKCLGVKSYLLVTEYVTQFLSLLQHLQHPSMHALTMGGKEITVVYHLSMEEALPLFFDIPREVCVDLLGLHRVQKKRKKRLSVCPSEAMGEDGHPSQHSVRRMGGRAVAAGMPMCSRLEHMVQQQTTEDKARHQVDAVKKANGGYCCTTDAATQTFCGDFYMQGGKKEDGVGAALEGDDFSQLNHAAKGLFGVSCRSVGVNTAHPSPLMTFVDLLDAQEQLEKAQMALRHSAEALQLRERRLEELEKNYDEKLAILTHVLNDTEKMCRALALDSAAVGRAQRTAAEVEPCLLNLVEVIYGTEGESGMMTKKTTTAPILDTPEARAAALQLIDQHGERQLERRLHDRHGDEVLVADPTARFHLFPPVKLSRSVQLRLQAYQCPGCGASLHEADKSRFSFSKPRRCHYCMQLYCHKCHTNSVSVLPFLVFTAWEFTPRHVCQRDYEWLRCNWDQPWCIIGDLEEKMEKRHHCPLVLQESVQLAKVLRHWLLVSTRMVRRCTEPLPTKLSALLQTYYSNTDVMYSLKDLEGLKYSEDHGIAARELPVGGGDKGRLLRKNMSISHRSDVLFRGSSLIAATVGSIVTAIPRHRGIRFLGSPWAAKKEVSSSAAIAGSIGGDSDDGGGAAAAVLAGGVGSSDDEEEEQKDFLRYLVSQIRVMEQHLMRDCTVCVARATTVCELCGKRDKDARLPLADPEVIGLRLLERVAEEDEKESGAQLLRMARVAMRLVRGSHDVDDNYDGANSAAVACRRCGTRYHKACMEEVHCPHCT